MGVSTPREVCDFPGCPRTDLKGRGLCNRCYARLRYQGKLPEPETDLERFFYYVRILPVFGCWMWMGGLTDDGYGKFWADGRTVPAHRWIYQEMVGQVADNEHVDHMCFNRWCVNFGRCLQAVSPGENWLTSLSVARVNQLKTLCDNGHEFTQANTYLYNEGRARGCKKCRWAASRRHEEGLKGVVINVGGSNDINSALVSSRSH
jgi:hypothetical protein